MSEYASIDPTKNQGYLSFADLPDITSLVVQSPPFPKMFSNLTSTKNQGYLSFADLPDITSLVVQSPPFPKMMTQLISDRNQGYPSFTDITSLVVQEPPFPKMMTCLGGTTYNQGYPTFRYNKPRFGCFANVTTLIKATIPQTVKYIADYTFYNTSLTKVTIAKDCKYFEHTFPDKCEISYYE